MVFEEVDDSALFVKGWKECDWNSSYVSNIEMLNCRPNRIVANPLLNLWRHQCVEKKTGLDAI